MATKRYNMLRGALLLGVGIAIGAAFSAHTTSAQPSSPAPCTTTHKTPAPRTSTTRRTYALHWTPAFDSTTLVVPLGR